MQGPRCASSLSAPKVTICPEADVAIEVPRTHPLCSPLLTVLPLQLLAYRTALALDRRIDHETSPTVTAEFSGHWWVDEAHVHAGAVTP